MSKSPVV